MLDEAAASTLATGLRGAQLAVSSVEQKPYTRRPYAPFMTSTLQQADSELKEQALSIQPDLRSSVDNLSVTLASRVLGVEIDTATSASGR